MSDQDLQKIMDELTARCDICGNEHAMSGKEYCQKCANIFIKYFGKDALEGLKMTSKELFIKFLKSSEGKMKDVNTKWAFNDEDSIAVLVQDSHFLLFIFEKDGSFDEINIGPPVNSGKIIRCRACADLDTDQPVHIGSGSLCFRINGCP